MKTLFRCVTCLNYTLEKKSCPSCGSTVKHPYPARFSLIKERRYRPILRK
ncbi:MAG: nucleolar RNA-binding Nop10p family protein [Candidatus Kariarchaeaceae archaeon]